jgi:hypothetical protein
MRSCSDSIAQLAAALAKAQMELVNPVKCLTAVIDRWGTGNEGQSYRYAPLSAGLEIVRKTLCKHELAVIQTTHLDGESGLVLLTTTLAHGSGEWVAASWPVCRAADMTNPKLMGAALTYARRYGLFTLVGLAGEDDLDAPELPQLPETNGTGHAKMGRPNGSARPAESSTVPPADETRTEPGADHGKRLGENRRRRNQALATALAVSAGAVDPLAELAATKDIEALVAWAAKMMPLRNRMAEAPRAALDVAFLAKAKALGAEPDLLLAFAPHGPGEAPQDPEPPQERQPPRRRGRPKRPAPPAQPAL